MQCKRHAKDGKTPPPLPAVDLIGRKPPPLPKVSAFLDSAGTNKQTN